MKMFSTKLAAKDARRIMPTIGVVGVTIPGAIDCISKIYRQSRTSFQEFQHPNIMLDQQDFAPIHKAQLESKWETVTDRLVDSIRTLAHSGSDFAIIPANTVHIVIKEIQERSPIPVLNMLDIVSNVCQQRGLKKIAVLGTHWTMSEHLYKDSLEQKGISEVIPSAEDQAIIQNAIFLELVPNGTASIETVARLIQIVGKMKSLGCDGILLACTELPLILNTQNCDLVTIDTTTELAKAAVEETTRLIAIASSQVAEAGAMELDQTTHHSVN